MKNRASAKSNVKAHGSFQVRQASSISVTVDQHHSALLPLRNADSNIRLQLEELSITGEQSDGNWHVGMDCIPEEWASLTRLTKLELRGHSLLNVSRIPEP